MATIDYIPEDDINKALTSPEAMAAFMARYFPGLTPAAALALLEAETTAPKADLSLFEEVAAARWAEHDKREAERAALVVALDGLNHLTNGQDKNYPEAEYQHAIITLCEASFSNEPLMWARTALSWMIGSKVRVGRKRLEAARLEVVNLLEASQ